MWELPTFMFLLFSKHARCYMCSLSFRTCSNVSDDFVSAAAKNDECEPFGVIVCLWNFPTNIDTSGSCHTHHIFLGIWTNVIFILVLIWIWFNESWIDPVVDISKKYWIQNCHVFNFLLTENIIHQWHVLEFCFN